MSKNEIIPENIISALKTVYDPEIPTNVYDLGLIYRVDVSEGGRVFVRMTLTNAGCPMSEYLYSEVDTAVRSVEGVTQVEINITFEPPWEPDMMTIRGKLETGMM